MKRLEVSTEEALKYSEEENAKHFYTSAKTGEGLEEIFTHITSILAKNHKLNKDAKKDSKKISISKEPVYKEKKRDCCN